MNPIIHTNLQIFSNTEKKLDALIILSVETLIFCSTGTCKIKTLSLALNLQNLLLSSALKHVHSYCNWQVSPSLNIVSTITSNIYLFVLRYLCNTIHF